MQKGLNKSKWYNNPNIYIKKKREEPIVEYIITPQNSLSTPIPKVNIKKGKYWM